MGATRALRFLILFLGAGGATHGTFAQSANDPAGSAYAFATPAEGLALSAVRQGRVVGSVRLWHVSAGGIPALMLGPLAVEASSRQLGVGAALMDHALAAAKARGHRAVILLGDAPYYARFGFSAAKTGELVLPGAFERDRLLGLELCEGALSGAWGMIAPTGAPLPRTKAARVRKAQLVPRVA